MSQTFPLTYIRGKLVKTKDATISIQSKAVQYGLGCFTGIRGNWNDKKKNLYLFRLEDHHQRLKNSAKVLGMKFNYSYEKFSQTIFDLIKKNKAKEDVYIRPTLYAASTLLTPRFDNDDDDLAIYMMSLKDYFKGKNGLNICVSSWRRFADDALSTKAKITGAYANSALAKTEAVLNGYDEALFLNHEGNVCEASGANVFGVKQSAAGHPIIYTPPLSSNILNGITRDSLITLIEDELKIELREEEIDRSTLYTFDELFFTGTAAKVAWIASVDRRVVGKGKMGAVTAKLKDLLDKIGHGELTEYSKWCTPIY